MNEDRLIVPYSCPQCGAPLSLETQVCRYCQTPWEKVERYRGPSMPVESREVNRRMVAQFGSSILSTATCYTTSTMIYHTDGGRVMHYGQ